MYKEYLALNNQQWLVCLKNKPNQNPNSEKIDKYIYMYFG